METLDREIEQAIDRLLFVRLNEVDYALDITQVQEVSKISPFTEVPLTSHHIKGLVNLRGEVIAVIDLRKTLQFPPCEEVTKQHRIIIVEEKEERTGLLVDEVMEMVQTNEKSFSAAPSNLDPINTQLISQVYHHNDTVYPVLNMEKILEVDGPKATELI